MVNSEETLDIYPYDESYVQLVASDRHILRELSEYFTFENSNAKFMTAYKEKLWDGKHRLFNQQTNTIYKGLVPYIQEWAKKSDYTSVLHDELAEEYSTTTQTKFDFDSFYGKLNINKELVPEPYDFQKRAITDACSVNSRATYLSATSSGKSLIIYGIIRYHLPRALKNNKKILLVVPTIGLVNQLVKEFHDYCPEFNIEKYVHKIYDGAPKSTDRPIVVSTWQSIYKQRKDYFNQFHAILIDEAHTCKASSLKGILEKATETKYRYGFTGTLDGLQYHRLLIEGLCGPVVTIVKAKELIDRKITSALEIKCLILKYCDMTRLQNKSMKYHDEIKFIINHKKRNQLIANLAKTIQENKKKNVLVITGFLDHIKNICAELDEMGCKYYVVHGGIDTNIREEIRQLSEKYNGIIIIATYGVFSTGINIKNLQYIIFGSPSKSLIRVLQTIGRILRKDGKDNIATAIDLVDDFSHKKHKNYILRHFFERIKIYTLEKFGYTIKNIQV